MSGTLARRVPTNGTASPQDCADGSRLRLGRCQAFVAPAIDSAQDQASAQQDPDIAAAAPVARLAAMPVVSLPTAILHWLCAAARTLAGRFRRPADPSSSGSCAGSASDPRPSDAPRPRRYPSPHSSSSSQHRSGSHDPERLFRHKFPGVP